MTAAALTPSKEYIENGVTLDYPVPFRFVPQNIYARRISLTNVVTDLVYGVDYSVTGGADDNGGMMHVNTAGSAGTRLQIYRRTPRSQDMDYTTADNFPAQSHEAALDKAMLIDQEQDVEIQNITGRALLLPDGELAGVLPSLTDRDGKIASFSGNTLVPFEGVIPGVAAIASNIAKAGGGDVQEFIDEADALLTDTEEYKIGAAVVPREADVAYLECFVSTYQGKGMLTAETPSIVTERALTNGPLTAGADTLQAADYTGFVAGGQLVGQYSDGELFVRSIRQVGAGIVLNEPLSKPMAAGAPFERVWYDRDHIGKRGIRFLAQRIAAAQWPDVSLAQGNRLYFCDFEDGAAAQNQWTGSGGATVYAWPDDFPALSQWFGDSGDATTVRRFIGRSLYVEYNLDNATLTSPWFAVTDPGPQVAKFHMLLKSGATQFAIVHEAEDGTILHTYYPPLGGAYTPVRRLSWIWQPGKARFVRIKIIALTGSPASHFTLTHAESHAAPRNNGPFFNPQRCTVDVFSNSWGPGDTGTTPERVGLVQALQERMPYATVRNKSVGGNTLEAILARFNTDILPDPPTHIVIMEQVNSPISPPSGVWDPNSRRLEESYWRQLIEKCRAAGIQIMIVGGPALAQPARGALAEWEVLQRSQELNGDFAKIMGTIPAPAKTLTSPTGTANYGAFTAAAAGDAPAAYDEAFVQGLCDRIAALESRVVAHDRVLIDGALVKN